MPDGFSTNTDLIGRHLRKPAAAAPAKGAAARADSLIARLQAGIAALGQGAPADATVAPSMSEVLATAVNIMQVRITRSRLVGEPADIMIAPRLAHLGLMEFHRAGTAIEAGHRAAVHAATAMRELLGGGA